MSSSPALPRRPDPLVSFLPSLLLLPPPSSFFPAPSTPSSSENKHIVKVKGLAPNVTKEALYTMFHGHFEVKHVSFDRDRTARVSFKDRLVAKEAMKEMNVLQHQLARTVPMLGSAYGLAAQAERDAASLGDIAEDATPLRTPREGVLYQDPKSVASLKGPSRGNCKVIVIGDAGVGKTNLIGAFCHLMQPKGGGYRPTLGVEMHSQKVTLWDKSYINAQIWDTVGQERYVLLYVCVCVCVLCGR